ncbi:transporter [Corynebacterium phocae]|uniref:Transporter n=1 Tax=Corynebacterium phocae TaxID=161895 RepID=A0A1L7D0S5_9CORY|nr:aspartate:alanine exchanger family transporter [Corynebacterium phocae]APT91704.1 transporter [Corynebacterium phocae]KAA8728610.1 transporter [Corynebacterium phocae]
MQLLVENQLLALAVIMVVGLLLGQISIGGFRLGVAAVLFVGLGFSALEPAISLPPLLYILGLALFVYTIGLEAGPTFFASMKTIGPKLNGLGLFTIIIMVGMAFAATKFLGIDSASGAGMFAGSGTNTAAMASIVDALPTYVGPDDKESLALPVVAYSLSYPFGVLIVILNVAVFSKIFKIDHKKEEREAGVASTPLLVRRFQVEKAGLPAVNQWPEAFNLDIIVSRIEDKEKLAVAESDRTVEVGDVVTIVGKESELEKVESLVGGMLEGLPTRDGKLDYRRVVVSSPNMVGKPLRDLRPQMEGALVAQVRRGDKDFVAKPDTILRLGDRVRVVTTRGNIQRATEIFGDSYRRISDVNLIPLALGLVIGTLIGMIEVPLYGDATIKLGFGGGPLLAGVVLGFLGRTGPIVWQMPYGANHTIRQFGIAIFLAGIGTTAGAGFGEALSDPNSLKIIAASLTTVFALSVSTILLGYKVFGFTYGETVGLLAGLQNQPGLFAYVEDHTDNELPSIGYTTVYPMSMVMKIVFAQILCFALFMT